MAFIVLAFGSIAEKYSSGKLIRLIVTPTTTKALLDAGYKVTVERSTQRIFEGTMKLGSSPLLDFE